MNIRECPFCGTKVNITYSSFNRVFNVWHEDSSRCNIIEPIMLTGAKSLTEAYTIWNRRNGIL